jgi:hypothetical protein
LNVSDLDFHGTPLPTLILLFRVNEGSVSDILEVYAVSIIRLSLAEMLAALPTFT